MPNTETRAGSRKGGGAARQRAQRRRLHAGAMRLGGPRDEAPPERGLPVVTLAGLPARDPLRAIHQILIEEIGEACGQLVATPLVGVAQVVVQRPEGRPLEVGQDGPQVPDGHARLERGGRRDVGQQCAERLPQERGGQAEPDVRRDAESAREPQRQPSRHPAALDDDHLGDQGRRRGIAQPRDQAVGQHLEAIAVDQREHRSAHPIPNDPVSPPA